VIRRGSWPVGILLAARKEDPGSAISAAEFFPFTMRYPPCAIRDSLFTPESAQHGKRTAITAIENAKRAEASFPTISST
jgi:hypothetical protein